MTILEILTAAAAYHEKTLADLTQLGLNLGYVALNQAKQTAQLGHDFNFQRKLLTLTVNSSTGASLDTAVIQGTSTTVDIKTIVNIGVFDTNSNFRAVPWTTAEEGQERMLRENRYWNMPWGGRDDARSVYGTGRFVIRGNTVNLWPIDNEPAFTVAIGIEAYVFDADWSATSNTITITGATGVTAINDVYYRYGLFGGAPLFLSRPPTDLSAAIAYAIWYDPTDSIWIISAANDIGNSGVANDYFLSSTSQSPAGVYEGNGTFTGTPTLVSADADTSSDTWTTKGAQYLLWQTVCNLNKLFKSFVARQEGNLSEPQALADAGLAALILWDDYKLEGFRTHGR